MENIPVIPPQNPEPELKPRTQHRKGGSWWALILILIGLILLVQNLHIANLSFHWWALFIFIPVFGSLSTAWDGFQESHRFSSKVSGSLGSAVMVGTVGTMLLFGMDWSRWWPLVVIAAGASGFLSGLGKLERLNSQTLSTFSRLGAWIGLGAMLLGFGFLVQYLPIPALQPYLIAHWWAIPIFIAGLGAVVSSLMIFLDNEHQMNWAAWSMLLIAVFIIGFAVLVFFALDWNLLLPIVLIACGLVVLAGIFAKK
ncbi:MAG: hypothetical protein AB9897_00615 [Anaerolineaceae bacterium]